MKNKSITFSKKTLSSRRKKNNVNPLRQTKGLKKVMDKAVFLDRDGVINKMYYHRKIGIIDTPLNIEHVEFTPGIFDFLKLAKKLGYLLILISNQPGVGIKKISKKNFILIKNHITKTLNENGIFLDREYYCMHHPFASIKKYRKNCKCRKPSPYLITKAAKDHNIDLSKSWVIGDGVFDVIAGYKAGCKTILLANLMETEYLRVIEENLKDIKPTLLVKNIKNLIDLFL